MDLLKKLIGHELITGSFFIFAGGMLANVLAFILNLFLARNLSYSDYAIFASLLSIVTLAAIPSGSFTSIIVKFATDYYSKGEKGKLKAFYLLFFKFVLSLSAIFVLISILFSPILISYLHLDSGLYAVAVGITIASFYLMNFHMAFLQSLLKFGFISFMNSFGGILKLFFGVGLVLLGFRAFGGLWAIFFMTTGMFLISFFPLRKILTAQKIKEKIALNRKEILEYSIPAFFVVLCMTSFTSSDVILARHFFSSETAGLYAGLSLIGRVIFYFTAPIPMVMFPLLVKRHSIGRGFINLFYLAILLVLLPSIAITALYFVRPNLVINIFLAGRNYLTVAPYLWLYGMFVTVFSVANLFASLFLSLNKTKIVYPVIAASVLQIVLINIFHRSFYDVIVYSLISVSLLLLMLTSYFVKIFGGDKIISQKFPFLQSQNV